MIEHWDNKTLGEICYKITDGSHNPPKGVANSKFLMLSSKNIFNDLINFDSPRFLKEPDFIKENKRTNIKPNDVLLTIVGTIGRVAVVPESIGKISLQRSVSVLKPNGKVIDSRFLMFLLQSKLKQLSSKSRGVAQKGIYLRQIREFPVALPSIPEQKHIVKILDKAFVAIDKAKANAEKNLQNSRELFDSYLNKVFTNPGEDWKEKSLKDISTEFGRGKSKHRPRNDRKLYGGKYPFIQTGNIRNSNHLIMNYSQTYNEVGLSQSKLWPKGTICITIAANIAETGILNFDSCFPDSVIGLVVDEEKTNIKFVEYLLQSFKTFLQAKGKGSAQDNINLATFENQLFPFPDLSLQKKIVIKLDALSNEIKKLESHYQRKLNDLEELKKALLQKAFDGKL